MVYPQQDNKGRVNALAALGPTNLRLGFELALNSPWLVLEWGTCKEREREK